jgi:hypothetical protein
MFTPSVAMVLSFRPLKILLSMVTGYLASITVDLLSRVVEILKARLSLAAIYLGINVKTFQSSTILCPLSRPLLWIAQVSQSQVTSAGTTILLSSATTSPTPSMAMVPSSIGTCMSLCIAIASRPLALLLTRLR